MSAAAEELYSLLIPLTDERLIVPRACVAEVARFSKPEQSDSSRDWLLGTTNWNGRDLPVIAFEGVMGKEVPAVTGRTRIVVFFARGGSISAGYFGVVTQGFPQLVRVNEEVLRFDTAEGWADTSPVLCRVKMINEFPLIPDLGW
ncbi:MAG: chemotaxis protein CheW [Pseudomonadota bacterium]